MKTKPLLPAILWAIVILILCGIPGRDIPHISFLELLSFDKWVHAGIFFVLTVLLVRGFRLQKRSAYFRDQALFLAAGLAIPYGGLLEIMQGAFFSERSADFYDFVANSAGCFAAAVLYRYLAKWFPKLRLPLS